jgi:plasmid stabilization system protein ParE
MKKRLFSIDISDEAEIDFDKSYEYYYEASQKVADAFYRQVKLSLEDIKHTPNFFPLAHKNLRKCVVKKFPFVIYYQIVESEIRVIAIFHTSRNPEIWNDQK